MMILRPARLNDIESILALAKSSGPMVYTLPADREALLQKIERSISAFEQDVFCPGEEFYFFVLEDSRNKKLVGTGAINALAGYEAPFYAFRNDTLIHSSRQLNVHSRIHALTLSHDLSDHSQLCSFYVLPNVTDSSLVDPSEQDIYRHCLELITLGRLLFMTTYPERFSRDWMAVLPGVFDNNGRAPFWEHVGRKFINLDYHQVEEHHGTQASTFIAELMPHHPLYVPLIAPEAQSVMGQNHPRTERQCHLLSEQGFNSDKYVEIFDAGPIFAAPRHALDIWQKKQSVSLKIKESINKKIKQTHRYLIGITDSQGFRSCFIEGVLQGEQLHVTQEHAHQAHLTQDQSLWCLAL